MMVARFHPQGSGCRSSTLAALPRAVLISVLLLSARWGSLQFEFASHEWLMMSIFSGAHLLSVALVRCLFTSFAHGFVGISSYQVVRVLFISRHEPFLRHVSFSDSRTSPVSDLSFHCPSGAVRRAGVSSFLFQFIVFSRRPFIRLRSFLDFVGSFLESRNGCWILLNTFFCVY